MSKTSALTEKVLESMICVCDKTVPVNPIYGADGNFFSHTAYWKLEANERGERRNPTNRTLWMPAQPTENAQLVNLFFAVNTCLAKAGSEEAKQWLSDRSEYEARIERKRKQYAVRQELLKAANHKDHPNPFAMHSLALKFWEGKDGFPADRSRAQFYAEKAHDIGHLPSTALLGWIMVKSKNMQYEAGIAHLSAAGGSGLQWAAYKLGWLWSQQGDVICGDNLKESVKWLTVSLDEEEADSSMEEADKENAKLLLAEVEKEIKRRAETQSASTGGNPDQPIQIDD